jgi:hypothetical protein
MSVPPNLARRIDGVTAAALEQDDPTLGVRASSTSTTTPKEEACAPPAG